ncbi:TorD/DmsD family molecular chaperone [Bradyrhizobium sp. AZCC 1708]|uniref:TorD/DmsD family molecular chaperone n=1 Tax=Bradyrhizobium sp. AZCC 1708 TaxID=3117015 RepID=UPI002FF16DFF
MTVLTHTGVRKSKTEKGDRRPQEAARAGGGVLDASQLRARLSNVPARPLSVEAVMDLEAEILWPEFGNEQPLEIDGVDPHRTQEYSLLAMLLSRSPDAATLKRVAKLSGDATPLGFAHLALAQAAATASAERVAREYFTLFIGVGRGELLPYGSYYLTGFLNERPLARLREDLRVYGIERTEGQVEPEDHAATRCEIMAGMAGSQFPITGIMQRRFFEKHLAPWIGRFFVELERAEAAEFYRAVGSLGRLFVETEAEAFMLPTRAEARNREET